MKRSGAGPVADGQEANIDDPTEPELDATIDYIRRWHGIEPPNAPGLRLAAQLGEVIATFARLRAPPELDAPPADFAATLRGLADDRA